MNSFWLNCIKYKWLMKELVVKDLKIKYRRSVLGYLWSLLNPLMMMTVLTIVFSSFFRFDIPNYPVYLLTGQLLFNFFAESTNMAMTSVIANAGLIKKVYLPKYIFPISRIISSFVTMIFSLLALFIVIAATGMHLGVYAFFAFLPLIYVLIFSLGVGLFLSVAALYFRDVIYLYGVILTILSYATPIFYPESVIPESVKHYLILNPMYDYIFYFRSTLIDNALPSPIIHFACILFSLASLFIGFLVFKK